MSKSADAFRTISEVADWLGVKPHVLRFWESKFKAVKPVKRAGGRRYYRPADVALLGGIQKLLHEDGMSIKAVQVLLRVKGAEYVASFSPDATALTQAPPSSEPTPDTAAAPIDEEPALQDFSAPALSDPSQVHHQETMAKDDSPAQSAPPVEPGPVPMPEPVSVSGPISGPVSEPLPEPEPEIAPEPEPAPAPVAQQAPECAPLPRTPENISDASTALQAEAEAAPAQTPDAAPEVSTPAQPFEPTPQALSALSTLRSLTAAQARSIAPLLAQLKQSPAYLRQFEKE